MWTTTTTFGDIRLLIFILKMKAIKRLLIKGLIYSYKMDRLAFEIKKFNN